VRYDDPLRARLEALRGVSSSPHRRGRDFEKIVAEIFARAGFDVVVDPGAARPRQTDVYASRGSDAYLIETKWQINPAGSPDVDEMRSRLGRQPPGVVGVLVTIAGITEEGLREIERQRERPILVVEDNEIESVLDGSTDLRQLLRAKHTQLTVHGLATGAPPRAFVGSRRDQSESLLIVGANGAQQQWIEGSGGFDSALWALDLGDIDWVVAGGAGVSLDLRVEVQTLDDVCQVFNELAALNWLTHKAAWRIQQSTMDWTGIGLESMITALRERDSRYASLERAHHREVLLATDACPGGWYTLEVDLDARSEQVYSVDVSVQLEGIPVDAGEIQRVGDRLGIADTGFFRPRTEKSVVSTRLREPLQVSPTMWIIEREPDDPGSPLWVRGMAFDCPPRLSDEDLPIVLEAGSVVLADLRSWHPADQPRSSYFLERVDWAFSSNAMVARAIVEWPDQPLA
jgi:hypothetical protein